MKKITLSLLLCAFALVTFAFDSPTRKTPPQAVLTAFQQKFPAATDVDWEKEKDGSWEGEFEQNDQEFCASFTAAGVWQETETEINLTDLPQAVRNYVATNYKNKKIKEATRIEKADGTTVFEADVKGQGDLLFDQSGNLLGTEKD